MNTFSVSRFRKVNWQALVMFALGFWLSSSLLFDCVVIPGLLESGMMNQQGFASAGYTIFGTFNHLELICAGLILAGILVLNYQNNLQLNKSAIMSIILMVIALVYTYIMTPQMTSLALPLNSFESTETINNCMMMMHVVYWILEGTKISVGCALLAKIYRNSCSLV